MRLENIDPLFLELFTVQPRKGDRTKFRIIRATVDCIAELGLMETNFESVGKRVKLARRNVAYHFPKIKMLLIAAIQYSVAQGQRNAVEFLKKGADTWESQLELYITSMFDWFNRDRAHGAVLMTLYYLATYDPEFRELYSKISTTGQMRIQKILENILPSPELAKKTAGSVYSLLNGNVVKFLATNTDLTAKEFIKSTCETSKELVKSSMRSGRSFKKS